MTPAQANEQPGVEPRVGAAGQGSAVAIGVDIGGTKIAVGGVTAKGELLSTTRADSPRGNADALIATVLDLASPLGVRLPLGIGIAGLVSADGHLGFSPNLDIGDVPVRAVLSERWDGPVSVANDATVALYGEAIAGAARGATDAVMFTLGTGVGGGVLAGGELIVGRGGLGGELGHMIVDRDGRACPCGNNGCIEAYASGTALGVRARELLDSGAGSGSSLGAIEGDIAGSDVTDAAVAGDGFAKEVVQDAADWLGVVAASLANALDPEVIVLGGGVSAAVGPLVRERVGARLDELLMGREHREIPRVVVAELGDVAGIIGAALWARTSFLASAGR